MASEEEDDEEMNLVTDQIMEKGCVNMNSENMFSLERDRYFRNQGGDEFRRNVCENSSDRNLNELENQKLTGEGTHSLEGSEEEDDDDDEEINGGSVHSSLNLQKHHSPFGSSEGMLLVKDGKVVVYSANNNNIRGGRSSTEHQGRIIRSCENAITIAEPETSCYSQFLKGGEGQTAREKSYCGFSSSSRKDESLFMESGESLRTILSDPVTGTLMDDAMILPCGHSFGSGGMQHVIRMKACYTCSQTVSEELIAANLSLRVAVQAFRQQVELQSCRVSKKRRERFEQDKSNHGDPYFTDLSRGKGVQFPFAVTDRVVIKGNKRTPLRFVGREAVVTTQCLNGWYVVKTLDNAESVKVQYRSLAKVSDRPSCNMTSSKTAPNWL